MSPKPIFELAKQLIYFGVKFQQRKSALVFIRAWSKNSKLMWFGIFKTQDSCTADDFPS